MGCNPYPSRTKTVITDRCRCRHQLLWPRWILNTLVRHFRPINELRSMRPHFYRYEFFLFSIANRDFHQDRTVLYSRTECIFDFRSCPVIYVQRYLFLSFYFVDEKFECKREWKMTLYLTLIFSCELSFHQCILLVKRWFYRNLERERKRSRKYCEDFG